LLPQVHETQFTVPCQKMQVHSLHDYTFATSTPLPLAIIEYHPTQSCRLYSCFGTSFGI